ncbi:MAG: hypothetical protein KA100_03145 [Rickettsiales bacterium]|nr:hypothetical protein [Rickettsiales bacterium]
MPNLTSFTPLTPEKLTEIIARIPPDLYFVASKAAQVLSRDLVDAFRSAENKAEFINLHHQEISKSLKDCGLMGHRSQKDGEEFIIGAEGTALVAAYMAGKENNAAAHPVQVVKNINLETRDGSSQKHANIFLEQGGVHDGLREALVADLRGAGDADFSKSYVVETFGTTGGSHFVAVTIHKKAGEVDPVVHLFDGSPPLARNGLEAAENNIANGWCSQLIVNATVKKSFEDCGLVLRDEKFFNNTEPLQSGHLVLCATFACEKAYEFARMGREEHLRLLQEKYVYSSPYGGKTEMLITLDEKGYIPEPQFGLPAQDVAMSSFVETALLPRVDELKAGTHLRKDGSSESHFDRIVRNQIGGEKGGNLIIVKKALRQKAGHLFEIVTSDEFLAKGTDAALPRPLPEVRGNPYCPGNSSTEESEALPDVFKKFLSPRPGSVNRSSFDQKGNCEIFVYLGDTAANKLVKFMTDNDVPVRSRRIDFANNVVGADPEFSKIREIVVSVPQERFEDLSKKMVERGSLYEFPNHPFAPPKQTEPLAVLSLRGTEGRGVV